MEPLIDTASTLCCRLNEQQTRTCYGSCSQYGDDVSVPSQQPVINNDEYDNDNQNFIVETTLRQQYDNKHEPTDASYQNRLMVSVVLIIFLVTLLFDSYQINVGRNRTINQGDDDLSATTSNILNTKSSLLLPLHTKGILRRHHSLSVSKSSSDYFGDLNHNDSIRIAFLGNSIMYYNDCPRIVQQMMMDGNIIPNRRIEQDSCLRGGASISSLWKDGNGVFHKFKTKQALISMEALSLSSSSSSSSPPPPPPPLHKKSGTTQTSTKITKKRAAIYRLFHQKDYPHYQYNHYYDVGERNPYDLLMKYYSPLQSTNSNKRRRGWDFVIVNDYTQGPARSRSRRRSIRTIKEKIAPLLLLGMSGSASSSASGGSTSVTGVTVPIIVQTHAYRIPNIKGSSDLGDFHTFSNKIKYGVRKYAKAFNDVLLEPNATTATTRTTRRHRSSLARIAPVGEAYRYLYETNNALFQKLYSWDNIHPSPYGTYLQANIIYMTCFPHHIPPKYNPQWWDASRYIMPLLSPHDHNTDDYEINHYNAESNEVHFPTEEEANELRRVACYICGTALPLDE